MMSHAFFAFSLMTTILFQGGSCRQSNMNGSPAKTDSVLTGTWGGEHMGLDVSNGGARVEYDCAHGTIDEPMKLDSSGYFDLRGRHVKEHGGPVREDEKSGDQPARYTGRIQDQTMTITVKLAETNEAVGTFTLTHDKTPRIRKCL
jgi:hypothetical protein